MTPAAPPPADLPPDVLPLAGPPPWLHLSHLDDVAAIPAAQGQVLLVACDSCAGIGDRAGDVVTVAPYVVGRFTCRVPLLEVLAVGGQPLLVVATLGVAPHPVGEAILRGVQEEASLAGIPAGNVLISTEKNIPTTQTSAGITVLAWASRGSLRFGRARPGDLVVAVGRPKVGAEVHLDDPDITDISTLRLASKYGDVGDLLPVGSGGIAREAGKLAARAGLRFSPGPGGLCDLEKSAGPATCFLATVPPSCLPDFLRHMTPSGRPCYPVGTLVPPDPRARGAMGQDAAGDRDTGQAEAMRR